MKGKHMHPELRKKGKKPKKQGTTMRKKQDTTTRKNPGHVWRCVVYGGHQADGRQADKELQQE